MSEMKLGNPILVDYEKKHKEEVARATQLWECGDITRENLEYIFPELKESEDEKVRKGIIELVKQSSEILDKKNQERMLSWLEKQGEQNFPILSNSAKTGKNWSEEDEKCIDNCCLLIGAADNCYEKTFKDDSIHYLQSLKERMGV